MYEILKKGKIISYSTINSFLLIIPVIVFNILRRLKREWPLDFLLINSPEILSHWGIFLVTYLWLKFDNRDQKNILFN